MANVIFKFGTKAQYDSLTTKDANTLYWLTDALELRKGEALYGRGKDATNLASGLMSGADKAKLDALSGGTALSLTPVDSTIVIADGKDGKTIGVKVSADTGNGLAAGEDGLSLALATATTAGAMSAEDKAALDSVMASIVWGDLGEEATV